ncbi:hypothetical protein BXZ70DRAFT_702847 [Cristinia sonorae]|uniref:Uncharacterized protein n=1 Tax=Cristinia sonorae TaxID=1940300 RepID=A0A8K0UEI0_9AGAR|nr:hypothetical protein BXZ70DRAFT_702847 [Cristinia sonorae]
METREPQFDAGGIYRPMSEGGPQPYIMLATSGAYLWEYFASLEFEWSFLTRRKRLTWPMIPYFVGRFVGLFAAFMIIVLFVILHADSDPTSHSCNPIRPNFNNGGCVTLYDIASFSSYSLLVFASANLAIRAMALYSLDAKIVAVLGFLILGQCITIILSVCFQGWSFLSFSGTGELERNVPGLFGVVPFLPVMAIYTAVFDIIVFAITAWKLLYPWTKRARLVDHMLKDGILYFLLVMLVNVPAAGFMQAEPLAPLNTAVHFPTAMLSLMVANRLVRRLSNFTSTTPSIYIMTQNLRFATSSPAPPADLYPVHGQRRSPASVAPPSSPLRARFAHPSSISGSFDMVAVDSNLEEVDHRSHRSIEGKPPEVTEGSCEIRA